MAENMAQKKLRGWDFLGNREFFKGKLGKSNLFADSEGNSPGRNAESLQILENHEHAVETRGIA